MGAEVASVPRCWRCRFLITDEPPITKLHRPTGQRADFHRECLEDLRRDTEARRDEAIAHAEERLANRFSSVPFWPRVSSLEFKRRVKHAKLHGVAENWTTERGNLCLRGPSGAGKSSVLAAIAWRIHDDALDSVREAAHHETYEFDTAIRTLWTTGLELAVARRQHGLGQGEAPLVERAMSAKILFIDELGQELADGRWLLEILDARYRVNALTLSTTGLTAAQLDERYGIAARRRLVEPKGDVVDCHG